MEGLVSSALRVCPRAIGAAGLFGLLAAGTAARAAELDLSAGVLIYVEISPVANDLTISLAGGTYTIDDPAEPSIILDPGAIAGGCAAFDSNTVTCPATAVASFDIQTRNGDDTISLAGATVPALIRGGLGADTILGGAVDDVIVWNPGDSNDTIDGGPGTDTLIFNGSIIAEIITIAADGTGFDLSRNIASVQMHAENTEVLQVNTLGGADSVSTTGLVDTTQTITDGDDGEADTLTFDAAGGCIFDVGGGALQVPGSQPVQVSGFPTVTGSNVVCGAILDLLSCVLSYRSISTAPNTLEVSRANATYTIRDAGEGLISASPGALAQGCATAAPDTVTCPVAAVGSFDVATGYGDDTISLAGATVPAVVRGGIGGDTIVGGAVDDVFLWSPGDASDTIDGGPGTDTLRFNGAIISETIAITAEGNGFGLTRNIGSVQLKVDNTEVLDLQTQGGADDVTTTPLLHTEQFLTAGTDIAPDTLHIDGVGLCLTRENDSFETDGRQPIHFASFPDVFVSNTICRTVPCENVVVTQGCTVNGARNQPCQGTAGNDVIVGTAAGDVIKGGAGNDRIRGGLGGDLLCGDEGDDRLSGGAGDDTLAGGPDADRLDGGGGLDTLLGGDGDDQLSGGSGADDLDGGPGNDRLKGGGDADTLQGGIGLDTANGGGDADRCADADQPGPFARCELP